MASLTDTISKALTPAFPCLVTSEPIYFPLLSLSPDAIQEILLGFDMKNILSCSLVCKRLNQITKEDGLWAKLYNRDFLPQYPLQDKSLPPYIAYKDCYKVKQAEKEEGCCCFGCRCF